MLKLITNNKANFLFAISLPIFALVKQEIFWVFFKLFAWFLVYPAVFFASKWVGKSEQSNYRNNKKALTNVSFTTSANNIGIDMQYFENH